ncbi:feruloyl-CoA synthase [Chachezhania antarctica]|uniref:feruloyl-CoA synthase n=1 Tax=Chachezhania antarctica TaxID=2340860 RepID=UPI000EB42BCA|nr:feruloyl-CoA synthase [Chachezhania antarctica]
MKTKTKTIEAFARNHVLREDRDDGSILLRSGHALSDHVDTTDQWLKRWAAERPGATFLAERNGDGWYELPYGEALEQARAIAAALLERGLGPDTPILIISGNSVAHGILSMAAHWVGIPTVPVAEQYALIPDARGTLRYVADLIRPRMIFAEDGAQYADALAEFARHDIVVTCNPAPGQGTMADLLKGGGADVEAAAEKVGPDSVVKILMTSGSTSNPKGVMTTHRMMCVNQTMYADSLLFLKHRPPRIVDWLPWNHVFGGSANFNQMLAFGGSLYIDSGKPTPALFPKTVENNIQRNGTIAYNVPVGFKLLRDEMKVNRALKESYFADLDMIFYAGASLPRDVWKDLVDMSEEVRGQRVRLTTSWGMTETAPACIILQEETQEAGVVGVPMPGTKLKLMPEEGSDNRFELRVKGPNITPGYFRDPDRTAEAFDTEGFFATGDAMRLVDPSDANRGLRFDGRITEDFKLMSGVWVRAGNLRLDMLVALAPLAADVVLTGEGQTEVGILIVPAPNLMAMGRLTADGAAAVGAEVQEELRAKLAHAAKHAHGASNRVTRALFLSEPPSIADGEITAKGNLNFRKLLMRRQSVLERLYDDDDPAVIRI